MAFLQWRRFNFFEKDFLAEPNDPFVELAKSFQITCSSSGNGYLVFGDICGAVYIISRQHRAFSFSAYNVAVTHCCTIINRAATTAPAASAASTSPINTSKFFLVTIGTDDSDDLVPVLKIWRINESALTAENEENLFLQSTIASASAAEAEFASAQSISGHESAAQTSANARTPIGVCIRMIRLAPNNSAQLSALPAHASVTVLEVFHDTWIAVGFNSGHCLVIRGELMREGRSVKMKLIDVSERPNSVTGLEFSSFTRTYKPTKQTFTFANANTSSTRQHIVLFASTRNEICSFDLSTREAKEPKILLDSFGCDIGCSCLKRDPKQLESMQFVVGRNDAIYFYNIDGRGPCLAYDGKKTYLYWFRNYLVVITVNDLNRVQSGSASSSSAKHQNQSDDTAAISGSSSLLGNSNSSLITIYDIARKYIAFSSPIPTVNQVISEWGQLYILTADRRICVFTECDTQTKLESLFRKNQFSLAIDLAKAQTYSQDSLADMFKHYGDHLYRSGDFDGAIQQYCQTIGVLEPSYVIRKFLDLQRIHNLTFYLQELHKRRLATEDHTTLLINCYVKLKDEQKLYEFIRSSDIVFDVDIAIRVLRQAGYFDNAIMLAKRHELYDSYFCILLEDKSDSTLVLDTFNELLERQKVDIVSEYLSKYGRLLMADRPDETTALLKSLSANLLRRQQAEKATATEANTNKDSESLFDLNDLAATLSGGDTIDSEFKAEKYLHIFLNNATKLIEYLEFIIAECKSIVDADGNSATVSFEISNTLLEMYLHSYKSEIKEDGLSENETKIMNFLQNEGANYDSKKAMILCQMSNFTPGVLYLYEKSRMFKQILAHFIARKDSNEVINICEKFGDEEPNLWVDALWFFSEIFSDDCQANILIVLEKIEKRQLLPPLMVVEILSKHCKVTLGVVRDYLIRWISEEQAQIEENERLIGSYREECDRIRAQIDDIKDKPRVFQSTKCAACSHALDLPSVHFMCGHSYHHNCFESHVAENEQDCPLCLPQNRKVLNELSMLENVKNVNELFQQELADSRDPFDVIARYSSQGLFNALTVVTDDGLIQTANQRQGSSKTTQ